jgi:phosphatidylglycerophosphate synthase
VKGRVKDAARAAVAPVADALAAIGITPNHLTLAGLVLAVFAGVAVAFGEFPLAGIVLVVSSLCDMLDGAVARRTGQ